MDFIKVYRQALMTTERETDPQLERIVIDEEIR